MKKLLLILLITVFACRKEKPVFIPEKQLEDYFLLTGYISSCSSEWYRYDTTKVYEEVVQLKDLAVGWDEPDSATCPNRIRWFELKKLDNGK